MKQFNASTKKVIIDITDKSIKKNLQEIENLSEAVETIDVKRFSKKFEDNILNNSEVNVKQNIMKYLDIV